MNAKKKTYGAILLVGLAALLVDKVFLAAPTPAAAALAPGAATRGAAREHAAGFGAPVQTTAVTASAFPQSPPHPRVPGLARDAFTLTPDAHQAILGGAANEEPAAGDSAGADAAPKVSSAAWFKANHKLDAVMTGSGTELAVVDGRKLQVGDSVDGCVLRKIIGQQAIFLCTDGPVVLRVALLGEATAP